MGFVVYTRRGCHLCEVLIEGLLEEIGPEIGHGLDRDSDSRKSIELRDIDTNPEWREAFDTRVPVLEFDGEWLCDYHLDRQRVRAVLDRVNGPESAA